MSIQPIRCTWCGSDPLYVSYHDEEWGVPEYDDRTLFAKLILDGAQAGLSWITILKRREEYYRAFEGLDPEILSRYNESDVERLMGDQGIIRNRAKINAAIGNARAYMNMQHRGESFSQFLWQFVDGKPLINQWNTLKEVPASTPLSESMSKALKSKGFKFAGPTIVYAFMQATGMVNDHVTDCFRYREVLL